MKTLKFNFNWKKIVTCCYIVYLLSLIIMLPIILPIIMITYFFTEQIYKEIYYKTFKKYHQEFWGNHKNKRNK